jgi:hypothetical protein
MLLGRSFGAENVNNVLFRFSIISELMMLFNADAAFYYCDCLMGVCAESLWMYRQFKCNSKTRTGNKIIGNNKSA